MAPAAQTPLCTPNDVMNWLSVAGVEMRLDDENLATGQTILVSATAALAAVTMDVGALAFPLIKGTTLQFSGGGMSEVVQVVLSATAAKGATSLSVTALSAEVPNQASARDSGLNTAIAARLPTAIQYGTAEVKRYCAGRYNASDLVNSWSVNDWATKISAEWICKRCCRPAAESIKEELERVRAELKMVCYGQLQIEDIATRTAAWPFIDAVTVNPAYWIHKARVEKSLSEATPTQFGQYVDWGDALLGGFDWGY